MISSFVLPDRANIDLPPTCVLPDTGCKVLLHLGEKITPECGQWQQECSAEVDSTLVVIGVLGCVSTLQM